MEWQLQQQQQGQQQQQQQQGKQQQQQQHPATNIYNGKQRLKHCFNLARCCPGQISSPADTHKITGASQKD